MHRCISVNHFDLFVKRGCEGNFIVLSCTMHLLAFCTCSLRLRSSAAAQTETDRRQAEIDEESGMDAGKQQQQHVSSE